MRILLFMAVLAAPLALAEPAFSEPTAREVQDIHLRDFHAKGVVKKESVVQDAVQRICTVTHDRPSAGIAKQLEADQMKTIAFPADGLMGDWKRGENLAQSGRGMTFSDTAGTPNGGSCYNCHQLAAKEISYGTLGPSLQAFGKKRGAGAETQKYVYGKIYNAKAYNACSQMPRLGFSGTLTEQQIKDLVAYLLDPASPVNE
jgi:L-cysteine S-thiosulfotransferase